MNLPSMPKAVGPRWTPVSCSALLGGPPPRNAAGAAASRRAERPRPKKRPHQRRAGMEQKLLRDANGGHALRRPAARVCRLGGQLDGDSGGLQRAARTCTGVIAAGSRRRGDARPAAARESASRTAGAARTGPGALPPEEQRELGYRRPTSSRRRRLTRPRGQGGHLTDLAFSCRQQAAEAADHRLSTPEGYHGSIGTRCWLSAATPC